jgi:hypothetical protein
LWNFSRKGTSDVVTTGTGGSSEGRKIKFSKRFSITVVVCFLPSGRLRGFRFASVEDLPRVRDLVTLFLDLSIIGLLVS